MAMLASKSSLSSGMGSSSAASQLQAARDYASAPGSRRTPLSDTSNHGTFASPTESEFSEAFDANDSAKSWDEKQVCDWLKSIGCGAYTGIFKENNVNGSNLIECDQAVLKEMGIKKIGDRVRIFVGIKALRNKAVPNQKKRNRDSIAMLDRTSALPIGTNYPRPGLNSKRISIQFSHGNSTYSPNFPYPSPKTESRLGPGGYFTGRRLETPSELAKAGLQSKRGDPTILNMPADKEVIRVIHSGQTKMLDITGWKTFEDVMSTTVRKMVRPDANSRNYCFYVHDPVPENPDSCQRLSDKELLDILSSSQNPLRGRLILRTIHSGEPSAAEIEKARDLAMDEHKKEHLDAYRQNSEGSIRKLEKMLGERPDNFNVPLSPAVVAGMSKHTPLVSDQRRQILPATKMPAPKQNNPLTEPDEWTPPKRVDSKKQKPMRNFQGARPPSELISHDLTTFFSEHEAKDIQRTVSMAQRRSARVSKALSRLSVASTFSIKDTLKDAPALPNIPTNFLEHDPFANSGGTGGKSARPLSVWRQSIASVLPSVREDESNSNEPDRKSFVSFNSASEESASRTATITSHPADDTGSTSTYLEDGTTSSSGTGGNNTLNEQYREALKADGEDSDEELDAFLTGNTFDKFSWMQGDLIGQGSFGSVYLALHAVTGELMAVKQVELPGKAGADAALEKRKESMLAALKREINLLSELQHEHIVQYLGVQATDEHLNIFLEYVPGGSVASMLNNYGHLQEPLIRNLVRQILDGLNYLHKRDIIHRDIKGANILVDNKGKVKISDFGISKKVDLQTASGGPSGAGAGPAGNKRVSMQGSVFWMAPEVVKQTSYTRKADIWSMGALIVEMFTGEHPFPKLSQIQAIFQLGTMKKPEIPGSASNDAQAFLEKTFEIDEKARPEAEELMKLPFLKPLVA